MAADPSPVSRSAALHQAVAVLVADRERALVDAAIVDGYRRVPPGGVDQWGELPERKRRPYLVLTRQAAIPVLTSVVVVALTRMRRGLPTEVNFDEDDGLPAPCVASFDNVETLPRWAFVERITRLRPERTEEVCAALRTALDC